MSRKRRAKIEIIMDVLEVLARKGEEPPSKIATYANLSYDRLQKLLAELEAKEIVERVTTSERTLYRLTSRGYRLLTELKKIKKLLGDFGLDIV